MNFKFFIGNNKKERIDLLFEQWNPLVNDIEFIGGIDPAVPNGDITVFDVFRPQDRLEMLESVYDENTFDRIQSYIFNNEFYQFKWNSSNNLTIISGTHSITYYFNTYHSTLPNFFRNNRGNEIFVESISRMGIDRVYREGDIMENFLYNDILTINAIII